MQLVSCSRAHTNLVLFQCFRRGIDSNFKCAKLKEHLTTCLKVFAAQDLKLDCIALYESKYFNKESSHFLRDFLNAQIRALRPCALNLIESFKITDNSLNSCIGNSYGDIYEQQLEWAKKSSLNQKKYIKGFEKYLKPFYTSKL